MIRTPCLLFLGDAPDALAAKVVQGIRDRRPDNVVAQRRLPGCKADLGVPDMSVAKARAAGAEALVIGVANRGGVIAPAWKSVLREALKHLDRAGARMRVAAADPFRQGAGRLVDGLLSVAG